MFSISKTMHEYMYRNTSIVVRTVYADKSRSATLASIDNFLAAKTLTPQALRKRYNIPADLKGGKAPHRQLLALPLVQYGFSYDDVQKYYDAFGEKLKSSDVKLTSTAYKRLQNGISEGKWHF